MTASPVEIALTPGHTYPGWPSGTPGPGGERAAAAAAPAAQSGCFSSSPSGQTAWPPRCPRAETETSGTQENHISSTKSVSRGPASLFSAALHGLQMAVTLKTVSPLLLVFLRKGRNSVSVQQTSDCPCIRHLTQRRKVQTELTASTYTLLLWKLLIGQFTPRKNKTKSKQQKKPQ